MVTGVKYISSGAKTKGIQNIGLLDLLGDLEAGRAARSGRSPNLQPADW
jgi:hypothetical protein